MPEPAGGGEGELPGARSQVHDSGARAKAVGVERVQILGRVGIALLPVVTGHEGRVEVLGSCVRQFVDHPCLSHEAIVPGTATGFPKRP